VIDQYRDRLIHLKHPGNDEKPMSFAHHYAKRYYRIAAHYGWAMRQVFDVMLFDQAILLEDDMDISPDFFDYFDAMLPLLRRDPTLYCVSSWNDNGKTDLAVDPRAFYRADFMPGLGWMLTRKLWEELRPKWPASQWDQWMRKPDQRQGRACIIPEISRNFNFGKEGTSGGLYYDEHIGKTLANQTPVNYTTLDVAALEKDAYDARFLDDVYQRAELVPSGQATKLADLDRIIAERYRRARDASYAVRLRVEYKNMEAFQQLAGELTLMGDICADVPRGSYLGVVVIKRRWKDEGDGDGTERVGTVYVAPPQGAWTGNIAMMTATSDNKANW